MFPVEAFQIFAGSFLATATEVLGCRAATVDCFLIRRRSAYDRIRPVVTRGYRREWAIFSFI